MPNGQISRAWLPARMFSEDAAVSRQESCVDNLVIVERPFYSSKHFDQGFEYRQPTRNIFTWLKSKARECECSCACMAMFITSHLPFLAIMKEYIPSEDLMPDIIAGLTVGVMHIPQGMAYGQLSTLPPVYGLYVSFFPVILYFFFGTSKHVSTGTFAVISLMVGSTIEKSVMAHGFDIKTWNATLSTGTNVTFEAIDNSAELVDTKLKIAMSVTFATGVFQLLLGVFNLGLLTEYMSDPLISGFTTGAACHVFTSQIKHIFGIQMGQYSGAFRLIFSYRDVVMNLPKTNMTTFTASIVCMFLLVAVKELINNNPKIKPYLKMPVPIDLIVVILGTVISSVAKLDEKYDVIVVGHIPTGIPTPNLAAFHFLPEVIADSFVIAIVAFAISVSMAKIFARKHDYMLNANQELLAFGLCNIFSSFFSSFVSGVSLSRSLVQENAGGKTQVTGLVSSALILLVLLVVGPYFKTLPNCVLASIIIIALKGMLLQFLDLKALWGISLIDSTVWLVAFAATSLLDVDLGLLAAVVFALLSVIMRSQRPYFCLMGQIPGTDIYKDKVVYKMVEEIPNIKIFRFDSSLFFANADYFKASLYKMTVDPNELKMKQKKLNEFLNSEVTKSMFKATSEERVCVGNTGCGSGVHEESPSNKGPSTSTHVHQVPTLTDVHFVILDCSTMNYLDYMGVKILQQVILEMSIFNVTVYLAQCKTSIREMFARTNFNKTGIATGNFVTIHDAVISAQSLQVEDGSVSREPDDMMPNSLMNEDRIKRNKSEYRMSSRISKSAATSKSFL